jgi:hypothetical protein
MSDRTYAHVQAQQKTLTGSSPKSSLLQRTCACGQHTIAGGECSTCHNKQSSLLRSRRAFESPSASDAVPGSSAAEANGLSFTSAFERALRFEYDFSQIPVHSKSVKLQTKLTVNTPGDIYEQEADQVTEQVMRMAKPENSVSDNEDEEGVVQRKVTPQSAPITNTDLTVPDNFHDQLGSGNTLDPTTRSFFESRFNHDFSHVQVHTDSKAATLAQALNARAYTVGQDIIFGAGQYTAGTTDSKRLLAHELTHILQQEGGYSPRAVQRKGGKTRTDTAPRITMEEFIGMVKRIEAAHPEMNALEIEKLIARTKYHSTQWDYLLPSLLARSGPQVTAEKGITRKDVNLLSEKLIVTLPGGGEAYPWAPWVLGEADPLHMVVGLVAQAEQQAPGAGGAGGRVSRFVDRLPPDVTQGDVATWLGDVGSAAAEWMTAHPHPRGGTTQQDYMDEYAPKPDLLADIDSVAMSSRSGAFVFNPHEPLSANLERFYFPYRSIPYLPREPGRRRRFHIFCDVRGFALEPDGVTLSRSANMTIDKRVQAFARWFAQNSPGILKWILENTALPALKGSLLGIVGLSGPFQALSPSILIWNVLVDRANDWQWFAQQFREFLQENLKAEGR